VDVVKADDLGREEKRSQEDYTDADGTAEGKAIWTAAQTGRHGLKDIGNETKKCGYANSCTNFKNSNRGKKKKKKKNKKNQTVE